MTGTEEGRRFDAPADRHTADVARRLVSFADPPAGARLLDVAHQRNRCPTGFPAASFDVVTASFPLPPPSALMETLAEFRRLLAPGGTVAVSLETQRVDWLDELTESFLGGGPGPPCTPDELDELLVTAGFTSPRRATVTVPKRLPDPAALWDWLALQGIPAALDTLPTDRAVAFREQVFRTAARMHRDGGIVLEFTATLHRATAP